MSNYKTPAVYLAILLLTACQASSKAEGNPLEASDDGGCTSHSAPLITGETAEPYVELRWAKILQIAKNGGTSSQMAADMINELGFGANSICSVDKSELSKLVLVTSELLRRLMKDRVVALGDPLVRQRFVELAVSHVAGFEIAPSEQGSLARKIDEMTRAALATGAAPTMREAIGVVDDWAAKSYEESRIE